MFEGVVEDRVAGFIVEIGEDDGVFGSEFGGAVEIRIEPVDCGAGGYGEKEGDKRGENDGAVGAFWIIDNVAGKNGDGSDGECLGIEITF